MLYYDRIDVSEGIYINKTSTSKEFDICHYWDFLNKEFLFQRYICNGCYDALMLSMNLGDIGILNINGADSCCIITAISESETITLCRISI